MKCERCQKNPARVRVDEVVDGKRVQHFLCQSCAEELMSAMSQMGGFDPQGTPESGFPFGFFANRNAAGGTNTATAERQARNGSKTPTLLKGNLTRQRAVSANYAASLLCLAAARKITPC
jgi:ATP-dependent Clp protease ATP-binding subunit ClpC